MKQDLKYPIAKDKNSNALVSAKNVKNGINCNCVCFECNEDLIAINQGLKQRPHFRHISNSECKANFETYIHWLAKEVFKEIKEINLPEISEEVICSMIENDIENLHKLHKSPRQLQEKINRYVVDKIKSKFKNVKIKKVELEKAFKTNYGDVRIDIVLFFSNENDDGKKLFIEPFFSNQVDAMKLSKLKDLDISTLSIDLYSFINKKGPYYTIEEFKLFLINGLYSKKWVHWKKNKLISDTELREIEKMIIKNSKLFNKKLSDYINTKKELSLELELYKKDIKILQNIVSEKELEIRKKLKEIDELDLI
jgi:hypothetical protein